ncbi:MAG TPA: N-acetylmuramoyl-L-alanine amidase [Acidimicrobiales bacterium]|nr:N-acetylmuramoyl-L-alanine amidase [Acidimicrobiales bacterium]
MVALLFGGSMLLAVVVATRDTASPAVTTTTFPSSTTTTSTTTLVATTALGPVTAPPTAPLPPPAALPGDVRVVITKSGVVLPVLAAEGADRWKVRTPCGNEGHVVGARPVTGAAVVIDAGHGGNEPGAKSPDGLPEKGVNLAVALEAGQSLELQGFPTVLTRYSDYRVTIEVRAQIVQALRPKAFVSVHHNAEPDEPRPKPGSETYYQRSSADSRRLSGLLYEEIVRALSVYDVPWVGDTDAGAKYRTNSQGSDYYGILRRTAGVTSVLAELAFISNPPEADLLRRPDVQRVEGDAVARGIVRYLTTNDPGSGFVAGYTRTSPAGSGGGGTNCVDPPL